MSIALEGSIGELSLTVQVTRKDTGKVEEYQLSGFVNEEQLRALQQAQAPQQLEPEGSTP